MSTTSPLPSSRDPSNHPNPTTPRLIQTRAGNSKIWTQNWADSTISIHSDQTPKERNAQEFHTNLMSPDSSPPSLSKSTPSTTSPQLPSTPASVTHAPMHTIEEAEFHSGEKPNTHGFDHEPATPSSAIRKLFLGSSTVADPHAGEDREYDLSSRIEHSTQEHHSWNGGAAGHSPSTMIQTSTSATLQTKEADIFPSPSQDERYSLGSDLESPYSTGSTDTESDLGGPIVQYVHDDTAIRAMYWKRQLNSQELIDLSRSALGFRPFEARTDFLAVLEEVFRSWMGKIDSLTMLPGGDATAPPFSFTETQAGGSSQNVTSKKRKRGALYESDNEESGESDSRYPTQKRPLNTGKSIVKSKKWACPFYKHDRRHYHGKTEYGNFTTCAKSPGFESVSRIKTHLGRVHSPIYCMRCRTTFKKNYDLTAHLQSNSHRCDVRPNHPLEGLTAEQNDDLEPRDKSSKNEEERWNKVYKICFPNAPDIPDPYYVDYSQEVDRKIDDIKTGVLGVLRSNDLHRGEVAHQMNEVFHRHGLGNITGNATRQPNPTPRNPEPPALSDNASQPDTINNWEQQNGFDIPDMDFQDSDSSTNLMTAYNASSTNENEYALPIYCPETFQPHQIAQPHNPAQNYGNSSSDTMPDPNFQSDESGFSIFVDVSGMDDMDASASDGMDASGPT